MGLNIDDGAEHPSVVVGVTVTVTVMTGGVLTIIVEWLPNHLGTGLRLWTGTGPVRALDCWRTFGLADSRLSVTHSASNNGTMLCGCLQALSIAIPQNVSLIRALYGYGVSICDV